MDKDLVNETSTLSKQVKRLNYGQFLFLYLVAQNTSYHFSISLLEELKDRGAPDWGKSKGQRRKDERGRRPKDESGPPSYNSRSASPADISNRKSKLLAAQAPPLEDKSEIRNKYPELKFTKENEE